MKSSQLEYLDNCEYAKRSSPAMMPKLFFLEKVNPACRSFEATMRLSSTRGMNSKNGCGSSRSGYKPDRSSIPTSSESNTRRSTVASTIGAFEYRRPTSTMPTRPMNGSGSAPWLLITVQLRRSSYRKAASSSSWARRPWRGCHSSVVGGSHATYPHPNHAGRHGMDATGAACHRRGGRRTRHRLPRRQAAARRRVQAVSCACEDTYDDLGKCSSPVLTAG